MLQWGVQIERGNMMVRQLLMEVVIIVGYFLLEKLTVKLFKLKTSTNVWVWTAMLMVLSLLNFGIYWYSYVLIVWMALGIGLIFLQLKADHQFLYRIYWPAFGRISMVIAIFAFITSLFGTYLPTI